VVDSLTITTSLFEIINSANIDWLFVDQDGKEFKMPKADPDSLPKI